VKYIKDQVKLGFIGLGNTGSRIAQSLLDHGWQMSVYDRNLVKAETVAALGGVVAKSIQELASTVDVALSCLANEAVRSVYTRADGVFAAARPAIVVLEMGPISPETSRESQPWRRGRHPIVGRHHLRQHPC
jgi:3-hydroxyisobutyrate dehydrogenase-like beta-hydroxyacid dehydrogenase